MSRSLRLEFADNRLDAIQCYIEFVMSGVGKTVWDDLQHQLFLGDDNFGPKGPLEKNKH